MQPTLSHVVNVNLDVEGLWLDVTMVFHDLPLLGQEAGCSSDMPGMKVLQDTFNLGFTSGRGLES